MMGANFTSSRRSAVQQYSVQCVMPSRLLDRYQFFREICCLQLYSQIKNRVENIFLNSRSSVLNTEAVGSSEILVHTHETTQPCITDTCYLRIHCVNQNLISCSNEILPCRYTVCTVIFVKPGMGRVVSKLRQEVFWCEHTC